MKHESIVKSIESYLCEDPVSFHVPGHKNGRGLSNLSRLDVTEIPGTDNLHHPEEAILAAKNRAMDLFNSRSTYFLVNGTTGGNHAMILASTVPGDQILIARNVHKSVHTACILGDLYPEYISPVIHSELGFPLGIKPEDVEQKLKLNPAIKAVVITSPTYEGIHSDIHAIAQVVHANKALLLVDEAHGAHVSLHDGFGKSAIACGADMAVQSTHKSMNALTQASMLHVGTEAVDQHRLELWLSMLQSSSPSYVLMSSLEESLKDLGDKGKDKAETLVIALRKFRKDLQDQLGIKTLESSDVEAYGFTHDISKLVVFVEDAERIAEELREHYAIQVEYATADSLVCVTSIYNSPYDFERFRLALIALHAKPHQKIHGLTDYPEVCVALSPKAAFYSKSKTVNIQEATGFTSAEYVIPYPPGVPLLSPGEKITKEVVDLIQSWQAQGHSIIGMKDDSLKTLCVIE